MCKLIEWEWEKMEEKARVEDRMAARQSTILVLARVWIGFDEQNVLDYANEELAGALHLADENAFSVDELQWEKTLTSGRVMSSGYMPPVSSNRARRRRGSELQYNQI